MSAMRCNLVSPLGSATRDYLSAGGGYGTIEEKPHGMTRNFATDGGAPQDCLPVGNGVAGRTPENLQDEAAARSRRRPTA